MNLVLSFFIALVSVPQAAVATVRGAVAAAAVPSHHRADAQSRRNVVIGGSISSSVVVGISPAPVAAERAVAGTAKTSVPKRLRSFSRRLSPVVAPPSSSDSPWNKPRTYQACVLEPSGLRVMLVEDNAAQRIEAAFTAGVGQFDDPIAVSGLAHLTEHLLLSGPYSSSDGLDLDTWLEELDGEANGFTGFDSATFFVQAPAKLWREALTRFGYALRSSEAPSNTTDQRFSATAVAREVARVNEELEEDGPLPTAVRDLALLRARVPDGHPLKQFGPGSVKTLLPRGPEDGATELLGQTAAEFFAEAYSPESATLAIVAPVPIAELEAAVVSAFDGLRPRGVPGGLPTRRQAAIADPLPLPADGRWPDVFMVDGAPSVTVTWSLPFNGGRRSSSKAVAFNAAKPAVLLSHLLAHDGPGSLAAHLKARGFLQDAPGPKVSSKVPLSTEEGFALWEVRVAVSKDGAAQWRSVVACIFAVVAVLSQRLFQPSTGKPRDVLREAADEVSALADLAWLWPDRPATAVEIANDIRVSRDPAVCLAASRLLVAPDDWEAAQIIRDRARMTVNASNTASAAAAVEAAEFLQQLTPRSARITVVGAPKENRAALDQDPYLGVAFERLSPDESLLQQWRASSAEKPDWWRPPPINNYISKPELAQHFVTAAHAASSSASNVQKEQAASRPLSGAGVLWSASCRPRVVNLPATGARILWHVPGCLYASGQFAEVVEPLGVEPLAAVTLWLPAGRIAESNPRARAANLVWLLSLQRALEAPLYGAALAGCRWEAGFFSPRQPGPNVGSGLRLAFEGYSDVLLRFATDVARHVGGHTGPASEKELEAVRRIARRELRRGQGALLGRTEGGAAALEEMSLAAIQEETGAMWASCGAAASSESQALVAGNFGTDAAAAALVTAIMTALPVSGSVGAAGEATTEEPKLKDLEPSTLPPEVLTRRPSWQGPVAQSLCLASGAPSLMDICGRVWSR